MSDDNDESRTRRASRGVGGRVEGDYLDEEIESSRVFASFHDDGVLLERGDGRRGFARRA